MELKQCPECGYEVDDDTISCPSCGSMVAKQLSARAIGLGIVAAVVLLIGGTAVGVYTWSSLTSDKGPEWYEIGTLQDKTALDWQKATPEDKLATCADFVLQMQEADGFRDSVAQLVRYQLHPMASQLLVTLDVDFRKEKDPELNRKRFADVRIADEVRRKMRSLYWLKEDPPSARD